VGNLLGSYDPFNGSLDDVRVYNRALAAAEISALSSGGSALAGSVLGGRSIGGVPISPISLIAALLLISGVAYLALRRNNSFKARVWRKLPKWLTRSQPNEIQGKRPK
jgi:hypothetical protein